MISRRQFFKIGLALGAGLALPWRANVLAHGRRLRFQIPGGSLDPTLIPKYVTPLVKPPAMPPKPGASNDYEIAMRQFQQQILPASMGLPQTTVWSYGSIHAPGTVAQGGTFNYPAFTIEATHGAPVQVKWINDLIDQDGHYLPHILPVDQTLHWANPPGGEMHRDHTGMDPSPYMGPVPMVTHLHGSARVGDESDGYAEAWYLPAASDIPAGYATDGTWYNTFKTKFAGKFGVTWEPGTATFQYPNEQRAGTLWYHDHTLGMTRLNVYAGPAGFYLLRGGPDDLAGSILPGPAPTVGSDPFGTYYEIPIAIQDRSFNDDGTLFYPDNRAFFEGLTPDQLQIPFIPDQACDGQMSDIAPIWNPEFFGNVMVVNGMSWPYLEVERRRYRFRFLNGCNSRFLILKMSNDMPFYQIGTEGGFLPTTVQLNQLLMSPAERADVIVDFTNVPVGTEILLLNLGPDEPFKGFNPDGSLTDGEGGTIAPSEPATTGQVLQFRVVAASSSDLSTPPLDLVLPAIVRLGAADNTRQVSLNEEDSATVRASDDGSGNLVLNCESGEDFGPRAALLGRVRENGTGEPLMWMDEITENPVVGDTEVWEIYNYTMDAHPIHVHELMFEVIDRETFGGDSREPEAWESGLKDTVIAYPNEITRIKAKFETVGRYVWHCHIVEHEDNEMMRPYEILPHKSHLPIIAMGG